MACPLFRRRRKALRNSGLTSGGACPLEAFSRLPQQRHLPRLDERLRRDPAEVDPARNQSAGVVAAVPLDRIVVRGAAVVDERAHEASGHVVYPDRHLGVLGQAGATAYFGLLEAGQLQPGDQVLVSTAAGGVGVAAGQIARIRGASQVVGITGSDEKCRWLVDQLGYDAAINYKSQDVGEQINAYFPDGIDVYFDNVGGDILNQALAHLALHARVVVCGFISTDYAAGPQTGPANYRQLIYKRARMEGFIVFDYWNRFHEAEADLFKWYEQGLLKVADDIDEGLEKMPEALAALFTGGNTGVKICRIAPDPEVLPGE